MILHKYVEEFEELIELTSQMFNIPLSAVRKDYYITVILKNIVGSAFADSVVFKGGTSLSKSYPNSIERFSEDIDLTYIPDENLSDSQISKKLKKLETILISNGISEKIIEERSDRNKSSLML